MLDRSVCELGELTYRLTYGRKTERLVVGGEFMLIALDNPTVPPRRDQMGESVPQQFAVYHRRDGFEDAEYEDETTLSYISTEVIVGSRRVVMRPNQDCVMVEEVEWDYGQWLDYDSALMRRALQSVYTEHLLDALANV